MAEVEVAADAVVVTDASDLATSLEECLAELELREEEDGESGETKAAANERGERARRPRYPVRPGEAECAFYMRTGNCKFGANCKFNHPPNRRGQGKKNESGKSSEADKNDIPEQAELSESKETNIVKEKTFEMDPNDSSEPTEPAECKYYLTTGGCKFGKSCKFSHLKEKTKTEDTVELNFLGLPIRLGEKECQFYMKTGSCKFASNCKFHHPDPTAVADLNQNGATLSLQPHVAQWNMQMPTNRPLSPYLGQHPPYAPYIYPHHLGTPMNSEWNGYSVPDWNMTPQPSVPSLNVRGVGKKDDVSTAQPQQRSVEELPERPGEPECQHYMKTGNCKFRSACRYHHPKNRSQKATCILSPAGLPLRPGQTVCAYFSRYGVCKFGPACRFDHSMIESPSTAPLTSTPSAQPSDESLNSSEPVEPACEDTPKEPVETPAW